MEQSAGCGVQGDRLYLPLDSGNTTAVAASLAAAWVDYRYITSTILICVFHCCAGLGCSGPGRRKIPPWLNRCG